MFSEKLILLFACNNNGGCGCGCSCNGTRSIQTISHPVIMGITGPTGATALTTNGKKFVKIAKIFN